MVQQGQFDLKGLVEFGVRQGLGKVEAKTGLMFADDLVPLVGPLFEEMGWPEVIEVGVAGVALGKLMIAGLARQRQVSREAEERRAAQEGDKGD